jgi:hypothetical protein
MVRGRALDELIGRARAGDLVVVQYSGHGSFVPDRDGDEPDGLDECLCPWDVATQGPIVDDELAAIYKDRPRGVRLLMVSDSCHSGTVARFAPIRTPPTLLLRRLVPRPHERRLHLRGAERPQAAAPLRHLPALVRRDPQAAAIQAVSAVAESVRDGGGQGGEGVRIGLEPPGRRSGSPLKPDLTIPR